jgi:hypothetical protein
MESITRFLASSVFIESIACCTCSAVCFSFEAVLQAAKEKSPAAATAEIMAFIVVLFKLVG